jgi:hypothetical protein
MREPTTTNFDLVFFFLFLWGGAILLLLFSFFGGGGVWGLIKHTRGLINKLIND